MDRAQLKKWIIDNKDLSILNSKKIEGFNPYKEQERIQAMLTLQNMIYGMSSEESQIFLDRLADEINNNSNKLTKL